MSIKWKVEKRQIKELTPHPKNPRKLSKHDANNLQVSIEKFGMIDKPIINQDNVIIGGHQRVEVLKLQKMKTVECWVPDRMLDEKEVNELNLRLNRNQGEFDWDMLANEFDLDLLTDSGFTAEEMLGFTGEEAIESAVEGKGKKKKMCPQCGHEF